jgi:hypothetical protein
VDPHWFKGGSGTSFFYLNADPNPGSQTNPDPDPGQTLPSQKVEFYRKNIVFVGNRSSNIPTVTTAFFKGWNQVYLLLLVNSLLLDRIHNTEKELFLNQCSGSGSVSPDPFIIKQR